MVLRSLARAVRPAAARRPPRWVASGERLQRLINQLDAQAISADTNEAAFTREPVTGGRCSRPPERPPERARGVDPRRWQVPEPSADLASGGACGSSGPSGALGRARWQSISCGYPASVVTARHISQNSRSKKRPQASSARSDADGAGRQDASSSKFSRWSDSQSAQISASYERLVKMTRRVELSYIGAGVGVVVIVVGAGAVIFNWGMVRSEVSRETAEVVAETIRDKQLQYDASEFSKELLNQLLTDQNVAKMVSQWTLGILSNIKNEIGDLFVHILALEPVVGAVNRLADRLVEYLCSNRKIQEKVGQLLVDAICLDASRNAAAQWAIDLVKREDVIHGFRDLVVTALQTEAVVSEARSLAVQIVNTVLNDPGIQQEARRALNETLQDSELRATAKDSLWSIVTPWGSRTSKGPSADKKESALKSLDEVMVLDALTPEERQVLRSLQARVRNGSEASQQTADNDEKSQGEAHGKANQSPSEQEEIAAKDEEERLLAQKVNIPNVASEKVGDSTTINEASVKDETSCESSGADEGVADRSTADENDTTDQMVNNHGFASPKVAAEADELGRISLQNRESRKRRIERIQRIESTRGQKPSDVEKADKEVAEKGTALEKPASEQAAAERTITETRVADEKEVVDASKLIEETREAQESEDA